MGNTCLPLESWWLLTNAKQLTVQSLDQFKYVLVYATLGTTHCDITYSTLKVMLNPNKKNKIHFCFQCG